MDQLPDHILIKPEGRFTASTDSSIRLKQVITTTNIHNENTPCEQLILCSFGVFRVIENYPTNDINL